MDTIKMMDENEEKEFKIVQIDDFKMNLMNQLWPPEKNGF